MIVLIDNYDSFVHNLARYFERLGQTTRVFRNDAIDAAGLIAMRPDAIVLSPGPCTPDEAGHAMEIVRRCWEQTPILGVCLGHQIIAQALGGKIMRAARPMHGVASPIVHDGQGVFAGIPSPVTIGRYHSLIVDEATLPTELEVSARSEANEIMGLRHRTNPVVGIQFHPESILTEHGYALLAGFLRLAGLPTPDSLPTIESECPRPTERPIGPTVTPVPY